MKTWLITGCSSGIGKGIAKAVLESGDQAIVTARNKDKVMDIVEAYPETALAVSLDVCSQDSIKNAVKEVGADFDELSVLAKEKDVGSLIAENFKYGKIFGVTGVPFMLLDGKEIRGAISSYEALEGMLNK